jgi:hypothetical protein
VGAFLLPIYAAVLVALAFYGAARLAPALRRRGEQPLATIVVCAALLAVVTAVALVVTGAISGMWS